MLATVAIIHVSTVRSSERDIFSKKGRIDKHDSIPTKMLAEAENERMHLMFFIEIAKPNLFERILVISAQGIFMTFYTFMYIFFPRTSHRMIGYFEDEAIKSYTEYLELVESGLVMNINAPKIENKIVYRSLSGISIIIVLFIYKLMKPFKDKLYYNHNLLLYNCDNSVVKPGLFSNILNWLSIRGFFQDYLDRFVYVDQFFIDRLKRKLEPYEDHFEKDIIFCTKQAYNKSH